MRNFYITIDYNKTQVQLSASIYSSNVNVTILTTPSPAPTKGLSVGAIAGISIGGLAVLAIIVVVCCVLCKPTV